MTTEVFAAKVAYARRHGMTSTNDIQRKQERGICEGHTLLTGEALNSAGYVKTTLGTDSVVGATGIVLPDHGERSLLVCPAVTIG
jgi:hypothetical protein